MPAAQAVLDSRSGEVAVPQLVRAIILARVAAAGGATRSQVVRDLSALFSHKFSPAEWRRRAEGELRILVDSGLAEDVRNRFTVTNEGRAVADQFLGRAGASGREWSEIRDGRLIAIGLEIDPPGPKKLKSLMTPDGLRSFILQKTYGLPTSGTQTTAKLRAQLAVVALERAFGNKIKTGLGAGSGFSAKAGRLLAGQLFSRPRDPGTDGRLVALLAAECVDARQSDAEALRTAILRKLADRALSETDKPATQPAARTRPLDLPGKAPVAANDAGLPGSAVPPTRRPDPARFAQAVQAIARTCADGWAGNRKALISRVWQQFPAAHPDWGITEIEFKCMLGEAHRTGHLRLATADLKDKSLRDEFEASAITYKNTQWHLIRVTEPE